MSDINKKSMTNNMIKELIWNTVKNSESIAICGHIRPDGDCVGSCMSLYLYIRKAYPEKAVYVYMENVPEVFGYICNGYDIITDYRDVKPELFISLDCSDSERLGSARTMFDNAPHTINIDHHISNLSFAEINHFVADSSSTCEVLYELLDDRLIDTEIATALYTGIIHDSGVFQYSNTSKRTMEIGGLLIEKGVRHDYIIDESFYKKSYKQNILMARCVLESRLYLDNTCIVSVAARKMMEEYDATASDLEGIVNQLRITRGTDCAVFMHETDNDEYKVSLRANNDMDVSKVALKYGGGGHVKAAGCTIKGKSEDIIARLLDSIVEVRDSIRGGM